MSWREMVASLVHLSNMRREFTTVNKAILDPRVRDIRAFDVSMLMVFNGDTIAPIGSSVGNILLSILNNNTHAQAAVLKIPDFRGKSHLVSRSDLEKACMHISVMGSSAWGTK
jgi:hypothetical protein